jgi:hypothetical protein
MVCARFLQAGCRSVCTVWVQIYFQAFFGLENVAQAVDEVAATASSYSDFLCAFCVPIESRSPCCSSNEPCPDVSCSSILDMCRHTFSRDIFIRRNIGSKASFLGYCLLGS